MRAIDIYQTGPVREGDDGTYVRLEGGGQSVDVPGRYLEAQFTDGTHDIAFLTHGILHEEQLSICLLSEGVLLDLLEMGWLFTQSALENISVTESRISFCFPASKAWRLSVSHDLNWRSPLWFAGVTRQRKFQSYFNLEKIRE